MGNKEKAIIKLGDLVTRSESLIHSAQIDDTGFFEKWYKDIELSLIHIFQGDESKHVNDFRSIKYGLGFFTTSTPDSAFREAKVNGIKRVKALLLSFIDEINEYWDDDETEAGLPQSNIDNLRLICMKFHSIARQLLIRHSNRNTIEITDEYDVQDLLSSLLRLHFNDIRQEEYTPSYAGGASRIDFLLDEDKIALEVKKTRDSLKDKEVGSELLIDIQRYKSHPKVKKLVCFIYDPEGKIRNPVGLKKDLENAGKELSTEIIINPVY